jgi:hypothetical protein
MEELRGQARRVVHKDEFVVTLDGGIVFPFADVRIEITRAADSIRNSAEGPYMRVARGMAPQLGQQATTLSNAYKASSKTSLVVCDDGIGTGGTLRRIIHLLAQFSITISRFITITNPENRTEIDGVPVTTVYPTSEGFIWLNERDLYWGLPRSGLSIYRPNQFVAIGGVPYTLSVAMVKNRIGLSDESSPRFRQANLTLNKLFWQHLEKMHGRQLTLKDCSRLQFFGDHLGDPNFPIVELISETESGKLLKRLALS